MATLIAMHGLPRSGKSTISRELSRQLAAPIVNADSIRLALHGQVYATKAEPMVRAIKKIMIASLFGAGHEYVIADETHYSRAARDFVRDGEWETYFYDVPTSAAECVVRANNTNQPWLLSVIPEMALRHEPLQDDEPRLGNAIGYAIKCLRCGNWMEKPLFEDESVLCWLCNPVVCELRCCTETAKRINERNVL